MSLTSTDTGSGDFKLVPEGTHIARSYLLADIGCQETNFGTKLQVVIGWEIPGETLEEQAAYIRETFDPIVTDQLVSVIGERREKAKARIITRAETFH